MDCWRLSFERRSKRPESEHFQISEFKLTDDLSHLDDVCHVSAVTARVRGFSRDESARASPQTTESCDFSFNGARALDLVEAIINGLFFAQGSQTGIIGGVTQAIVLSLFNIGVALAFGLYWLPDLRHVAVLSQVWYG